MKRISIPRILAAVVLSISPVAIADMPAAADTDVDREHYLLELSCNPSDADSVGKSLRTALALREDGSTVTLFIESAAVLVADPSLEVQPPAARREMDRLFNQARTRGIAVLVCPHCAEQLSIGKETLRKGLRFTDQQELEAERKRAHKIYLFRTADPPAANSEPPAGCQPG